MPDHGGHCGCAVRERAIEARPWIVIVTALAMIILLGAATALADGRIHGTVTTRSGKTFTGPLRWDKNENFWDDALDATKGEEVWVEDDRDRGFSLFGIFRFGDDGGYWTHSQFSIPFGHIRSIEAEWGEGARIELKNGDVLEVRESGSDLGDSMRDLVIDDPERGRVTLEWKDLDRVEFSQDPAGGGDRERIYGTVRTRRAEYTGGIVWDKDESLLEDVLDGDDREGHRREIPFERIASIRRRGGWGADVTLKGGTELTLDDTNDVDRGNRGIDVSVAGLGRVQIEWDEFEEATFEPAAASPSYDQFDGGSMLRGVVTGADGESYEGRIVWDRDETYDWEELDGEADGVEFGIQFANIRRITRTSGHSAEVELLNGDVLELWDSNDVDEDNKGIVIVNDDGDEVVLEWFDFETVVFEHGESPATSG